MRHSTLPLIGAAWIGLFNVGCDELVDTITATVVVAGTLIQTPEVKLAGQFDVQAETLASVWFGERDSPTSTNEPMPLSGAELQITFGGNAVTLPESSEKGLYSQNSLTDSNLSFEGGIAYTFEGKPSGNTTTYGGTVTAPTPLTPAAIQLSPQPGQAIPGVPQALQHPINTALQVSWERQYGAHGYVTVFRANPNDPQNPEQVFDNTPKTAQEIIEFIIGTAPRQVDIPASTFSQAGVYAVVLAAMDKGQALPNTFIGSPILAGSAQVVFLGVVN